jgi:hypothetical protein
LAKEVFDSTAARKAQAFYWDCGAAANGWYELRVTGWALRNNAPINNVVRFYHRRQFQ